ncbi:TonB-dependent receptor [Pseudoflavitalea rhizosphaerae]|uniref:TonB-dependent receptor n=1 Tax=Pseudoflavitalea rhizosphaerae TaxID=1884793 RepID=UPI000F8D54A4|nr:TonB-dependent receptor [Pseudoflavitalea rhizosphaerae]
MQKTTARFLIMLPMLFVIPLSLAARQWQELKGKVTDEQLRPLAFATVKLSDGAWSVSTSTKTDGSFTLGFSASDSNYIYTLEISYVGKATLKGKINQNNLNKAPYFKLRDLNLKLPEVEVNGVRRVANSNSSIIFDREAIEQTQALSLANVMNYLPGQTIVKPVVTVQGNQILTMRSALGVNSIDALNNAFGINFQLDGASVSNDANMQAMPSGRSGFFGANNIQNPENSVIGDRSYRNGTLFKSYSNEFQANTGIDMRSIPVENIESIEVISGVASAKYGDYTTGVVNIERQAGITPWRVNIRTNEATQNFGINKGFSLKNGWGAMNIGFDYLYGKDDPRNSLKNFKRTNFSILWSYQNNGRARFKNTLSIDGSSTLDKTDLDPELGTQRMARMENKRIRISNRSSWTYKRNWFYDFQIQGSYSIGEQDSYDQYYLNTATVKPMTDAMETGMHEGYFIPGYYLAFKQLLGKPITFSGRVETNSLIKFGKKITNKLSIGANYSYNANKGAGLVIDPDRPRFANTGNKNDRPRPFRQVPTQSNAGVYVTNEFKTKLFKRSLSINLGIRGDIQNQFFTVSPRVNTRYTITDKLNWNAAFGIATKAPGLNQISPGNVYVDVPVAPVTYNGNVKESLYLVHTQVIELNDLDIRPYRSRTFETGFTYDIKPFHLSAYYFYRENSNGFTTQTVLMPFHLPYYDVTSVPGQKPTYTRKDTNYVYNATYNRTVNGAFNTTNGIELGLSIDKIRSIQTSFSFNTTIYYTHSKTKTTSINTSSVRYDLPAVYGVYGSTASKLTNIKSTVTSSTHIPALRMAVMLTGELFWVNSVYMDPLAALPIGYYTSEMKYFPLSYEEAGSDAYQHLRRNVNADGNPVSYNPPFLYPNVHLRLSKEIGDFLRFSFNAYNVFNIRPTYDATGGPRYFNGQPSYGAELSFKIN